MPTRPTDKQLDSMKWGFKLVGTDLCTSDQRGGRFRYHLGQWVKADGPFTTTGPCPSQPGDGLCVANTLSGAQSGGARIGSSVMLEVGYLPADVLCDTADKVRVKRLYVKPDPIDPVALIVWAAACGAYLGGADLRSANLRGADLGGADLGSAYLGGADLRSAYLGGADLRSAYLGGAFGDSFTTLPTGWIVSSNGYVVPA